MIVIHIEAEKEVQFRRTKVNNKSRSDNEDVMITIDTIVSVVNNNGKWWRICRRLEKKKDQFHASAVCANNNATTHYHAFLPFKRLFNSTTPFLV